MKKKFSAVFNHHALQLRMTADSAAGLTNRPSLARELVERWYAELSDCIAGKKSTTLGMVSEDVVGILLAAHQSDPSKFGAGLAADAAALSAAVMGGVPKPAHIALARWQVASNDRQ